MATAIVASVMAGSAAELRAIAAASADELAAADYVEVRADRWREGGEALAAALATLSRPAIVAVRPPFEGGEFRGSESDRLALLRAAARMARFVDVEQRSSFARDSFAPARKIVSRHELEPSGEEPAAAVRALRAAAADAALLKLAIVPRSLGDVARLAELQREQGVAQPPLVTMALGELGLPSRLLAGRLGAPLVYGRLAGAEPTAPGQPAVGDLAQRFRVREQTPATRAFAVVGRPVAHSLGPRLHNTLLKAAGLDRVFVPLLASSLDEALAAADALGIDGLSVTLPFKQDAARAATGAVAGFPFPPPEGAVNTLQRDARGWLAANTDRIGFVAALERGAPESLARGRTALVLGAGGVARTAVATLVERGLRVTVASRTEARATELARAFGAASTSWSHLDARSFDLVVNATPVGMHPEVDRSPLGEDAFRAGQVVFDLVYRPRETRLLAQARRAGARAIDGLEMFLAQALAQFAIFTGRAGDEVLARATLLKALT